MRQIAKLLRGAVGDFDFGSRLRFVEIGVLTVCSLIWLELLACDMHWHKIAQK